MAILNKTTKYSLLCLVFLSMIASSGCLGVVKNFATSDPELTKFTSVHQDMMSLPTPHGKIPVCVYHFRDQTGQYKPQENVSSFSTAVTQGATSILIQALKDSGWFITYEREGLQDLLTERKILRATMKNRTKNEKFDLRPLDYARVLIEGGITAYETNINTGGFGAEYWGLGGSVMYRQDQVTLYLRAIDVQTGQVLKSVSTTKTILSKEMSAGIFRYINFKRLLEIEGGFTTNEPTQLCVTAAIQKAVICLVVEGLADGLWSLKDPTKMSDPIIQDYLVESGRKPARIDQKTLESLLRDDDDTNTFDEDV